jgi:hypothetical protein
MTKVATAPPTPTTNGPQYQPDTGQGGRRKVQGAIRGDIAPPVGGCAERPRTLSRLKVMGPCIPERVQAGVTGMESRPWAKEARRCSR